MENVNIASVSMLSFSSFVLFRCSILYYQWHKNRHSTDFHLVHKYELKTSQMMDKVLCVSSGMKVTFSLDGQVFAYFY